MAKLGAWVISLEMWVQEVPDWAAVGLWRGYVPTWGNGELREHKIWNNTKAWGEREAALGLSVAGNHGSFSETMLGEKSHGQLNSQGQKI